MWCRVKWCELKWTVSAWDLLMGFWQCTYECLIPKNWILSTFKKDLVACTCKFVGGLFSGTDCLMFSPQKLNVFIARDVPNWFFFIFLSDTTTHEVIKGLLKKFKVVDNPRKFALYERHYEHGETAKGEQLCGAVNIIRSFCMILNLLLNISHYVVNNSVSVLCIFLAFQFLYPCMHFSGYCVSHRYMIILICRSICWHVHTSKVDFVD